MPLSPSDRALGDLLVGRRVITLPQLDEAEALAETRNVRLGDALPARNGVDPRRYYETYARHFDLAFVDLVAEPPDPGLMSPDDAGACALRLTLPWRLRDGRIVAATAEPGPETVLFARERWGNAIEFVVASKFDVIYAIQASCADTLSEAAVFELVERDPAMSARQVASP